MTGLIAQLEDWQRIEQALAAKKLGTPEADGHLVAAKRYGLIREAIDALNVRRRNQETVVKASEGVSGRIKAAAIKLGYDPATAENTALDFLIEHGQAADRLRAELLVWEKLLDPVALHANLLRGIPAQLTREMLLHLAGNEIPLDNGEVG